MMSDHWKLLANLLGTPGPAEPAAKEPTKKKPDVSLGENKSTVESPSGNPIPRDPLAEIVIRQTEPVVPGFDVPATAPVAEKPAKRSAWDTLIGTLGIKPASEPEPVESASTVSGSAASTLPRPTLSTPASRPFAGDVATPSVRDEGRPAKRGFGSGLVDTFDPSAGAPAIDRDRPTDSTPARIPSFRESEPRESRESNDSRPRRDSRANVARASASRSSEFQSSEPRSASPRSSEGRSHEPHSGETRPRDSRPSNTPRRDELRQSDSRKRDSRPRDTRSEESPAPRRNDPKQDLPAKASGFGDGLDNTDGILDWDVDQDDVYLRDDDLIDDSVDVDEPASDAVRTAAPASRRDEEGRPRGRGRRGGSRNRGRDDSRNEAPVEPVSDDIIGWGDDDGGGDSVAEPIRSTAPRADAGRADSSKPRRGDGRDESRSGRSREPRRDAAPRDEIRREPSPARDGQRREPVREEVRRDAPARETPRRQDRPEDATPADGGRTGRRGQRQQMGAAGSSSPRVSREDTRLPEVELDYDDLMSEELPSPSAAPAADSGDEPTRPRRRRGRRGRGGGVNDATTSDREPIGRSRTVEEVGFGDAGFAAELSPDAIDSVELNDDHEDDEEAEEIRRSRRRGRGRGEPRERTEPVGSVDSLLPAADDAVSVSKNRGVPTWLDTVSLLVEPNIERHRRTGPPRSPQGRGGRR